MNYETMKQPTKTELKLEVERLRGELEALKLEHLGCKPLYSRRKLEARLTEATALLETANTIAMCEVDFEETIAPWLEQYQTFLSRAPAQPAAPEPFERHVFIARRGDSPVETVYPAQPAAPAQSVREFGEDAVRLALEEESQLRAALATVTAEREEAKAARERLDQDWKRRHSAWLEQQAREVKAHAETRKALGETEARWQNAWATVDSTRADLAKELENCGRYSSAHADVTIELRKAEARVKELESELEETESEGGTWKNRAESAEAILVCAMSLCEKLDGPSSVACDIERALEALRG